MSVWPKHSNIPAFIQTALYDITPSKYILVFNSPVMVCHSIQSPNDVTSQCSTVRRSKATRVSAQKMYALSTCIKSSSGWQHAVVILIHGCAVAQTKHTPHRCYMCSMFQIWSSVHLWSATTKSVGSRHLSKLSLRICPLDSATILFWDGVKIISIS